MGLFDSFAELVAAAMPWETVEAEAPPEKSEEKDEGGDEVCCWLSFCFRGSGGGGISKRLIEGMGGRRWGLGLGLRLWDAG